MGEPWRFGVWFTTVAGRGGRFVSFRLKTAAACARRMVWSAVTNVGAWQTVQACPWEILQPCVPHWSVPEKSRAVVQVVSSAGGGAGFLSFQFFVER